MFDPVSLGSAAAVGAASAMGKQAVNRGIEKITNRVGKVDKGLSENFEILGKEIILKCPDCIQQYSISLVAKKRPHLFTTKDFNYGKVRRVSIRQLRSMQNVPNAIYITDSGFTLDLTTLQEGEEYLLDMEYEIEDPNFIDSLVDRRSAIEPKNEEEPEYWLVAQLKHPQALHRNYGRIDVRDIDVRVDVAVHQTLNMKIPTQFKENLETIAKLSKPSGRGQAYKDFQHLIHQHKKKYSGEEIEILSSLQNLFAPSTFKTYVDVKKDFYCSSCERGADWYNTLPFPTWPKFMTITSRADLTLENYAANGTLVYKKKNFLEEVEKLFH